MNKLYVATTALFLASTAVAHAGNSISFQIDGQHVRIETPRNCASLDCVTIIAPGLSNKPIKLNNINLNGLGSKDDDDDTTPSTTNAQPAPAPAQQPVQQAPVQSIAPAAPAVTQPVAPATTVAAAPSASVDTTTQPAPVAPAAAPASIAAAPVPAHASAPVAAAPAPSTPVGVWATEENKGNVRVEQCGANLCGYAEKSNERILINMKPEGSKWSGHIHDPDSGRNYDSTIAMKGPNLLRVQGCAFGGMFCGGQTWKRVS
ncbi:DUF2147 domain-containing protein [Bradyrhizobium neotropicale]|uniref:DUF2147 domain-containing protein n=1 Tax=Bradyrhizobium neotropicale TaxID=1497615 RepID=A0A176ZCI5_9BRAD|nr:DUF2147 domain-containing protein [Bradyrhizobium neotropicale]OAF18117.1 hypothetical protein AXW67_06335 [Bradyrhizobium neotropicale]